MTSLSYSVTESIQRQDGRIMTLIYNYEETQEQLELNLLTLKQDRTRQYRHYQAVVKREEYERMIQTFIFDRKKLSFDSFIRILRPIMMGTFSGHELQDAFDLLDADQSGTIDVDELAHFLPIIHSDVNKEKLLHYVGKTDVNSDEKLDFDEFSDMVLRGMGEILSVAIFRSIKLEEVKTFGRIYF